MSNLQSRLFAIGGWLKDRLHPHARNVAKHGKVLHRLGRWKLRRWARRITLLGTCVALFSFIWNFNGIQEKACSVRFMQPKVSDICGNLGLGNKPTHAERVAWEKLPPGDCDALADYARRFSTSPLNARAAEWHELRRTLHETNVSDFVREAGELSYVRQAEHSAGSQALAEAGARQAALDDAKASQCAPADADEMLMRVELMEFKPQCREIPGAGWFCGADYKPRCLMHGRRLREWCGPSRRTATR